ncbi:MAG: hypothetical protein IPP08_06830 [Chlorobiota bacterium]|nr:MAG: hypothetical protein IPP08_06830 [Chlorobiota bacterium]
MIKEAKLEINGPEKGIVFFVGTPIGNKEDITLRALRTLEFADVIVCEEEKIGATLLRNYNISKNLITMNEHNESESSEEIISLVNNGQNVAVVSDAGLPLLADPGNTLLKRIKSQSIKFVIIPGVSSVTSGLLASGYDNGHFEFVGFLPRKTQERRESAIALSNIPHTVVLLETPYRMRSLLNALSEIMPNRIAAICLNMTMPQEIVVSGTLLELQEKFSEKKIRAEFVLVLAPIDLKNDVRFIEKVSYEFSNEVVTPEEIYDEVTQDSTFDNVKAVLSPEDENQNEVNLYSVEQLDLTNNDVFVDKKSNEKEKLFGNRRSFETNFDDENINQSVNKPFRSNDRKEFGNPNTSRGTSSQHRNEGRPLRDDSRGGFGDRPRRDDSRSGFGDRPRRDDSRGGFGDRPRRDDSRGGFGDRPRRDDSRGGFGDRPRSSDSRGGFGDRPRSSDSRGGFGDRPRRDDSRGGFGGDRPRSSDSRGGFGGDRTRSSDSRGGFGGDRTRSSDSRGGFGDRPRRDDSRGGFGDRPRSSDSRGGFGGDRPRSSDSRGGFGGDRSRSSDSRGGFGGDRPRSSDSRGGFGGDRPRISDSRGGFGGNSIRGSYGKKKEDDGYNKSFFAKKKEPVDRKPLTSFSSDRDGDFNSLNEKPIRRSAPRKKF